MGSEAPEVAADRPPGAPEAGRKLSPGPGLAAKEVASHQLARIYDATIQLVAEHGYKALKVRDIVRGAEVSTRAFYEHFGSKEDCFSQAHQMVTRRATRHIIGTQVSERNWRKRSVLIFDAFARELESEPAGARVALIETYAAGGAFAERAWQAERNFEGMLAESFARSPGGVIVPPMVIEGIVAGILSVAKNSLLRGKVAKLSSAREDLVAWASSYVSPAAIELEKLDHQSVWRDTTLESVAAASSSDKASTRSSPGDRALILAAVADLAAANGYAALTAPRVRAAASVSRRKFDAYFDSLEDCYLAALEQRAGEVLAQATRAQAAAQSEAGGVYRAISAISNHIAGDPFLARVCLTDDFPPGLNGTRSRQRLVEATVELLTESSPSVAHIGDPMAEASIGALWSLFHHHVIRNRSLHSNISATLSYFALAPTIGASRTLTAIQAEQG
jgi:AcrR family transcriptional regulator